MTPVPSSEGEKINWINYRTGLKGVYLRMEANEVKASIKIEITQESDATEESYFNQLKKFRKKLAVIEKDWNWESTVPDGRSLSKNKIETSLEGVSILNKGDWPLLISFFKQHLIVLDAFWNSVKYSFRDYN
jgi:hypothetical protein